MPDDRLTLTGLALMCIHKNIETDVIRSVTKLNGARGKFGTPLFGLEIFRKQMYCIEESICDIAGTFRRTPQ